MSTQHLEGVFGLFISDTPTSISVLSGGAENTNYLIETSSARFVLRRYNQSHSIKGDRDLASVEQEITFLIACSEKVPIATPIQTGDGHYVVSDGGSFFALFTFVDGEHPEAMQPYVVAEYARVISGLYNVSSGFGKSSDNLDTSIFLRAVRSANDFRSRDSDVMTTVSNLRNTIIGNRALVESLPTGLVHGDIKLANTLFVDHKLTALLDFDDYRFSYLLEDTVMAIMHNIHVADQNILRSGHLPYLLQHLTNDQLTGDTDKALDLLIQSRLLYEICKFTNRGDMDLVYELLNDQHIAYYLP